MNRGSLARGGLPSMRDLTSMRPRFMNRGSDGNLLDFGAGPLTSMRPRFMNRGSEQERKDKTSMRPRFMNRGSLHSDLGAA